jgi:hypothetical protein
MQVDVYLDESCPGSSTERVPLDGSAVKSKLAISYKIYENNFAF